MSKLVVTEYMSLDGVMDEPGEWSMPFFSDEAAKFKFDATGRAAPHGNTVTNPASPASSAVTFSTAVVAPAGTPPAPVTCTVVVVPAPAGPAPCAGRASARPSAG